MSLFRNGCDANEDSTRRLGDEWKSERYDAVTATDVAKIMGLDLECSRMRLFLCKYQRTDTADHVSPVARQLMRYGKEMEPFARDDLLRCLLEEGLWKTDLSVQTHRWSHVPGIIRSTKNSFLTGTPDVVHVETTARGTSAVAITEIKTHSFPNIQAAHPYPSVSDLPIKHWLQLQTYLEIGDLDYGFLWSWTECNGATLMRTKRMSPLVWESVLMNLKRFYGLMCLSKVHPELVERIHKDLTFGRGEKAFNKELLQREMEVTTELVSLWRT